MTLCTCDLESSSLLLLYLASNAARYPVSQKLCNQNNTPSRSDSMEQQNHIGIATKLVCVKPLPLASD